MSAPTVERVREALIEVTDPEIPVITIQDLGILRDVAVDGANIIVTITPTYSGCPAMQEIEADVHSALEQRGWHNVEVRTVLSPAWTTDWMSESGRRKLREFGIAPPTPRAAGPIALEITTRPVDVSCPQCGSDDTEELARFASTSCKAMWRCRACREPFDHFKDH